MAFAWLAAARRRVLAYAVFASLFALLVFFPHIPFLDLPFFWDEAGYFIPAALDLFEHGLWLPASTPPNAHPPLLPLYLSAVWGVFGFSIENTRLAMLALGSLLALASFLLSIRLCRGLPGAPALPAAAFLLASPLFYTQSMMAQLDMPAALLTCIVLLLFLDQRIGWAAAFCVPLVLMKETGVVAPVCLAALLAWERRFREAALFLFAPAVLAAWLAYVAAVTGSPFGDASFASYNITYALHPARAAAGLARRLYYLFAAECRWAGTLAIIYAARRSAVFQRREWLAAGGFLAAHAVAVSLLGGAHLERYLLPALPVAYAAMAAAFAVTPKLWRAAGMLALGAGLIAGHFWNPPYPFPLENNLAMTRTVQLHRAAAEYLEAYLPKRRIVTAWPLSEALREPRFGYLWSGLRVRGVADFRPASLRGLKREDLDVLVLYSRDWEPRWNLIRLPLVERAWRRFFDYQPALTPEQCLRRWRLRAVMRWESAGQWVEVLVREELAAEGAGRRL